MITPEEKLNRLSEERDALKEELRQLVRQRRVLLKNTRKLRGEVMYLQNQVTSLEEMLKGNSKNEFDPLDLRFQDEDYLEQKQLERLLKQTKLLNITPDRRVAALDTEGPDDLD